jgi:hypothetical protein
MVSFTPGFHVEGALPLLVYEAHDDTASPLLGFYDSFCVNAFSAKVFEEHFALSVVGNLSR